MSPDDDALARVASAVSNDVDPQAYLTNTLAALVNGHKQSRIDDLMPWRYAA